MPNARPNIPDYEHRANLSLHADLTKAGYHIEASSTGYRIGYKSTFIAAADNASGKCHGRYREANYRDHLQAALRTALHHSAIASTMMHLA